MELVEGLTGQLHAFVAVCVGDIPVREAESTTVEFCGALPAFLGAFCRLLPLLHQHRCDVDKPD
ncbi:MAG: hypothetical protein ACO2PN_20660 [Pyrobaculum sp.]